MDKRIKLIYTRTAVFIMAALAFLILPEIAEARRGGRSFGGSRRSFRSPKKSRGSSFGKKSTRSRSRTSAKSLRNQTPTQRMSSFGGKKLNDKKQYTGTYGAPKKTSTKSIPVTNSSGVTTQQNYRFHSYGGMGFGSGYMMGYVMGSVPFYWSTPFHPAFYYSAPEYHENKDGSVDVYPGTFKVGKLFVGIIIIGGLVFVLYRIFFKRKKYEEYGKASGSFS